MEQNNIIAEHQKILNLLNETNDSKFLTKKWNLVNDQSNVNYNVGNGFIYNTKVLISTFWDYNNAYILVRGDITIIRNQATQAESKNCIPFNKYITKIDGRTIDNVEDLDLVMSMYNLIEHSAYYPETTESSLFYSEDEATDSNADIVNTNDFKSSTYKAKFLGNTKAQPAPNEANGILKKGVQLRYLSNFWRSLKMPLINYKTEIKLKWAKYSVSPEAGNDNEWTGITNQQAEMINLT